MAVNDYDALINQASSEWNVDPNLVRSIMQAESNGNQFDKNGQPTTSSAGALGLMQLMPKTAAGLGVTDPTDLAQNVYGGVSYI